MFKKEFKKGSKSLLSNKDRKKLLKNLNKFFDNDSIYNFFTSNDEIFIEKVQNSKIVIYSDNTNPMIIDSTSKGDYFPTIYCLQMFPDLCATVIMKETVEKHILNNANLMWPGINDPLNLKDFEQDEVTSIKNSKGEFIGVGAFAQPKKLFKYVEEEGKLSGMAVFVLHHKNDKLWESGDMKDKKLIFSLAIKEEEEAKESENKVEETKEIEEDDEEIFDFSKKKNKKKKNKKNKKKNDDDEDDAGLDNQMLLKLANVNMNKEKKIKYVKPVTQKQNNFKDDNSVEKKGKTKKGKKNKKEKIIHENEENNNEEDNEVGNKKLDEKALTEKNDQIILESFKNAVILSINESDLPLEPSSLWSNHMIPCRPDNTTLDIKASTYKKLGKFLQFWVNQKVIIYKEPSKKTERAKITKININNGIIKNWEPTITEKREKNSKEETKKENLFEITKQIIQLCKLKDELKIIFPNLDVKEWINYDIISENLDKYLIDNKLINKSKNIVLNNDLKDLFNLNENYSDEENDDNNLNNMEEEKDEKRKFKQKINKNKCITLSKEEIVEKINKKLIFGYKEINLLKLDEKGNPKENFCKNKFNGVEIITEFSHNKNVTKVTNLNLFGLKLPNITNFINNKFATSSSVHDISGKTKGKEIIVQGEFGDEINEFILNTIKIPKDLVSLTKKINKKKK